MRNPASSIDRQTRIAGIVGSMLVASVLTSGAVAAQDPTPAPEQGTLQVVGTSSSGFAATPVTLSSGTIEAVPGGVPGSCGGSVTVIVGPDGSQRVQSDGGTLTACGPMGMMTGPYGQGGISVSGQGTIEPFGGSAGPGAFPVTGTVSLVADPGRVVTVTSVAGDTVGLKTDDGWTRDLDTSNVVITLDKDTLTAADLTVGDKVQVVQVQNANDTWTITGLQLVLPQVMGVVSDVTADGFTVTEVDGTKTVVKVSDATTWPQPMLGAPAAGLDAVKDGDIVAARGKLAEDGSMDASSVLLQATTITMVTGDPSLPMPAPLPAPNGVPEATPEASPAA